MNKELMKHSKFVNFVFLVTSTLIVWGILIFFTSQFTDSEFHIDQFQLNALFTIIGIFGGVVISIFFYYARKFRDHSFEYQHLVEEWKEIKQKILFHKKYQTFEQNSIFLEEKQLEIRKVAPKLVYLVMSIFMTLLVWFVIQIYHVNQFSRLNEYIYALIILSGIFAIFIFGWYSFERALNRWKNKILMIKHYLGEQKIYLYKLEHGRPQTN